MHQKRVILMQKMQNFSGEGALIYRDQLELDTLPVGIAAKVQQHLKRKFENWQ